MDLFSQPLLENVVHYRENTPANQARLDENRMKFNRDCQRVLNALLNGERLTRKGAIISGLSGSLERRIADLKAKGINISTAWVQNDLGRKTHVEYYMDSFEINRIRKELGR